MITVTCSTYTTQNIMYRTVGTCSRERGDMRRNRMVQICSLVGSIKLSPSCEGWDLFFGNIPLKKETLLTDFGFSYQTQTKSKMEGEGVVGG